MVQIWIVNDSFAPFECIHAVFSSSNAYKFDNATNSNRNLFKPVFKTIKLTHKMHSNNNNNNKQSLGLTRNKCK